MMKRCWLLLLGLLLVPAAWAAPIEDVAGAKDSAGMPRYAGSVIFGYQYGDYDESDLPLGKAFFKGGKRGFEQTKHVEGKRTRVLYLAPEGRSSLEVLRNYTQELAKSGYAPLFECSGDACGKGIGDAVYFGNKRNKILGKQISEYAFSINTSDERLYVAEQIQGGAANYVVVLAAISGNAADTSIKGRVTVYLEQIQAGAMESRMVTLKSGEIQQALTRDGKAAIYGVLFDTDKAEIKSESKAQLNEMGSYLQQNPEVAVYVVGHTDNQGGFDYNLSLSQRRADAVVAALTGDYRIAANRLLGRGVANLAPVAGNQSEEGRAKNRRVELVLQ
jgi:outer membrane protein OmpA-like peptidoglycan-associated protein